MRYIETLTRERGNRLHATSELRLKSKVAQSKRTQHRGYPDDGGYVPFVIADPKHRDYTDPEHNLCSDSDPKRSAVFTACLGFPHLSTTGWGKGKVTIQKLAKRANCDARAVLDASEDDVQTILHERERLRMQAIRDGHAYALDGNNTLTADPVDRILITCARAAERRHGEVTAEGVRQVLSFKRNTLLDDLPFGLDAVTDEFLDEQIGGKTCAPLLPQSARQRDVLLYYIDNPGAGVNTVVDETGVNRGHFETFRLNLPDPRCYNRNYIASLRFDADAFTDDLRTWMGNSPHPVYDCSECSYWSLSKQGLAMHKTHADDHDTNHVLDEECPSESRTARNTHTITETGDADVDTLLDVFKKANGRDGPAEPVSADDAATGTTPRVAATETETGDRDADSDDGPTTVEFDGPEPDTDSDAPVKTAEVEGTSDPDSPADRVTDEDINAQHADKIAEIRAEHGFRGGRFTVRMQDGYGPYAWLVSPSDSGGDWHYLGKVEPTPEPTDTTDVTETDSEVTAPSHDDDADSGSLTAGDILAATETPTRDIASALLMSQTDVVNRLLDSLTDAEKSALKNAFGSDESSDDTDEPLQQIV